MTRGVYNRKPLAQRFLEATKGIATGCIEWQRGTDRKGYGKMWCNGKDTRASHVAWFLLHGAWPDAGKQVLHTCDNPRCVNAAHLFVGSIADNMEDKCRKNRQARGEKNGTRKLTDDKVRTIRGSALPPRVLAKEFGVDRSLIWLVRTRKIWTHV